MMKDEPEWILASGSPRRRELLARLNRHFRVLSAPVEEWEPEQADPVEQVLENARRKGEVVAGSHPEAFVVAADTTVALGERLFAKPADRESAVSMLEALSGRDHQVVTGVALFYREKSHLFHDSSRVFFRSLDREIIEAYIDRVHVYDKAGAYAIQDHGNLIIERYEGSFENIMGLPVQRLLLEMVQIDWMTSSS
ncbi:MAG TPA: Maf family protein [Oceanipulchritudo sp.]|nr:Maf family protein [Oceanipulchritudo sp.]